MIPSRDGCKLFLLSGARLEVAVDQRVLVARLNIEHFRRKLATETDEARRQMLQHLLAEEEAKLTALGSKNNPPKRSL